MMIKRNKYKKSFITIIASFFFISVYGQQPLQKDYSIQIVELDGKQPISFFSLFLLNPADFTFNKMLLTNDKGQVKANIPLNVEMILLRAKSPLYELDTLIDLRLKQKADLIEVFVKYITTKIQEVNITFGRNTIHTAELRSYKASDYSVPNLPVGKNLLRMLPGVSFLGNSYKVDGSFEPVFYINGTRVLSTTVENLPTERIERIEIVKNSIYNTGLNPNQVVLSVITKKETNTKIGGIISLNNSFTQRNYGGYATIHISSKKYFANLMFNTYETKTLMENDGDWFDELNNKLIYSRRMTGSSTTRPIIGTLSINADISPKLRLSYSLIYNDIKLNQLSQSYIKYQSTSSEKLLIRFDPLMYSNIANLNFNLNPSSNIFFRISHGVNDTKTDLNLFDLTNVNKILNQSKNKNENLNVLTGYDFKWKKLGVEIGTMFQRNKNSNFFYVTNVDGGTIENLLQYTQNIYSLYLKTSYRFQPFTVSLNNRVDIATPLLTQIGNQWRYLPSLNIFIPTKKTGSFTLTASRQIILPSSDDLSMNEKRQTAGVISRGTTLILPQSNLRLSLTHSLSSKKIEWSNSFTYENIYRLISYSPYLVSSTNLIERIKINIDREQILTFSPSLNMKINGNLSFTYNMDAGFYKANSATNYYDKIVNEGFFIEPALNTNIIIPSWFNASVNASFRNRGYSPFEVKNQQSPALSLTLSRSFFKKQLTINTSVYDMLNNSNSTKNMGISPYVRYTSEFRQPFRSISISASYIFHAKAFRYGGGNNKGIKSTDTKTINAN